ncbi:MAG: hypothetical protein AAF354_07340 [Pseudomonadota bacterium]
MRTQAATPLYDNMFCDSDGKVFGTGSFRDEWTAMTNLAEDLYEIGTYLYTAKFTPTSLERINLEDAAIAHMRQGRAEDNERNALKRWFEGAR